MNCRLCTGRERERGRGSSGNAFGISDDSLPFPLTCAAVAAAERGRLPSHGVVQLREPGQDKFLPKWIALSKGELTGEWIGGRNASFEDDLRQSLLS